MEIGYVKTRLKDLRGKPGYTIVYIPCETIGEYVYKANLLHDGVIYSNWTKEVFYLYNRYDSVYKLNNNYSEIPLNEKQTIKITISGIEFYIQE